MERESFKPIVEDEPKEQLESAIRFRPEGKKTLEKKRTPQEVIELKDRLRFVAKLMAKNFDLRVIPGDGWAAGLSKRFQEERLRHPDKSLEELDPELLTPEVMMYPQKDLLERSEDYIWGVFRHELGHVKHSDYQSLMEAQEGAKQEGYNPMDLFVIYDAWEDGRSNNMEGQTSKAARHRLGIYLKEDISEALLLDFEKKPLPIQYGALCWAKGAESFIEGFNFEELKARIKDEKVLKAFEKTDEALNEYLGERKGRKAFTDVLWQKGWPVFKELIDKYIEDEAKKNHEQKQEEDKGGGDQKEQQGQQAGEKPQEGKEGQQQPQEGEGQQGEQKKEGEEKQKGKPQAGEGKSWDELSPEEKEQYINEAREKLTEEEREFVKRLQPKSIQMKEHKDGTIEITMESVSPEDIKQAEQEEHKFEEQKKKIEQEAGKYKEAAIKEVKESLEKLKERETGLTKEEREKYEEYFAEVRKYVGLLVEKLDEVFPPQEEAEWEGGQRRGKRVDTKKLAREIPTGHGRVFEKKDVPEIKEAAFTLLVDVSGSMRGNKIEEALKAAMLMAEAFSRKGIPFEILAFHEKLLELKQFEDEYFGKKKLELMRVLQEVETSHAQYNDDGYAVDGAARRLQKRLLANDAQGALIIFSDGRPEPSSAHSGSEWELHDIVNKWSRQVPLIGIGVGPGMESTIKEYYGKNGLPVPDITKLPHALLDILRKQVARFEKRNQ
ncbi:VWA domain-containing protein [Patescibacteria group bacterium]|nr:VWA domain-containing protein [Patescibacteria group bacterium]